MKHPTSRRRIGLFGGTFNPIHLGHLRAAEEVREALQLERISFIPSRVPPHKQQDEIDPIASPDQRLDWVEQAVGAYENFFVDRIEIEREGPSYLVDTLTAMRDRDPGAAAPVFIIGEDAFAEMGEWREPKRIFTLADFAVMTRPPGQLSNLEEWTPEIVKAAFDFDGNGRTARHDQAGTRIELVSITAIDISSSQVRQACREERSIRFLVPESIREAIEKSGEYGPRPTGKGPGGSRKK
jgi:nicotinate-nucleotide adenylyltransferase